MHFGGRDDEPSRIQKEAVLVHSNLTAVDGDRFRGTTDQRMIRAVTLRAAWRPRAEERRRKTSVYPPRN
jgi:hypothetical protein